MPVPADVQRLRPGGDRAARRAARELAGRAPSRSVHPLGWEGLRPRAVSRAAVSRGAAEIAHVFRRRRLTGHPCSFSFHDSRETSRRADRHPRAAMFPKSGCGSRRGHGDSGDSWLRRPRALPLRDPVGNVSEFGRSTLSRETGAAGVRMQYSESYRAPRETARWRGVSLGGRRGLLSETAAWGRLFGRCLSPGVMPAGRREVRSDTFARCAGTVTMQA